MEGETKYSEVVGSLFAKHKGGSVFLEKGGTESWVIREVLCGCLGVPVKTFESLPIVWHTDWTTKAWPGFVPIITWAHSTQDSLRTHCPFPWPAWSQDRAAIDMGPVATSKTPLGSWPGLGAPECPKWSQGPAPKTITAAVREKHFPSALRTARSHYKAQAAGLFHFGSGPLDWAAALNQTSSGEYTEEASHTWSLQQIPQLG